MQNGLQPLATGRCPRARSRSLASLAFTHDVLPDALSQAVTHPPTPCLSPRTHSHTHSGSTQPPTHSVTHPLTVTHQPPTLPFTHEFSIELRRKIGHSPRCNRWIVTLPPATGACRTNRRPTQWLRSGLGGVRCCLPFSSPSMVQKSCTMTVTGIKNASIT